MEIPRFQNINNIIRWFLLVFVLFSFFYSYLNVEITTFFRLKELEGDSICNQFHSGLKFTKVIRYEKYKNTARLLCVYNNYAANQHIDLNRLNDRWVVISRQDVNTKNNFYWPIYL